MKQDEQNTPEKYSNCGQLFRLPDGLPIAPELLTKWYRLWRAEHPEFEQIVFHGLRHSSATYQLLQSDGDFKSVQGNTGHATASVLMDTYAHTQDKPRLELTEKIEANFYSQDLTPAAPQPRQNEKPAATKISGKEILEAIRLFILLDLGCCRGQVLEIEVGFDLFGQLQPGFVETLLVHTETLAKRQRAGRCQPS